MGQHNIILQRTTSYVGPIYVWKMLSFMKRAISLQVGFGKEKKEQTRWRKIQIAERKQRRRVKPVKKHEEGKDDGGNVSRRRQLGHQKMYLACCCPNAPAPSYTQEYILSSHICCPPRFAKISSSVLGAHVESFVLTALPKYSLLLPISSSRYARSAV
jgi:hypothetical protein